MSTVTRPSDMDEVAMERGGEDGDLLQMVKQLEVATDRMYRRIEELQQLVDKQAERIEKLEAALAAQPPILTRQDIWAIAKQYEDRGNRLGILDW